MTSQPSSRAVGRADSGRLRPKLATSTARARLRDSPLIRSGARQSASRSLRSAAGSARERGPGSTTDGIIERGAHCAAKVSGSKAVMQLQRAAASSHGIKRDGDAGEGAGGIVEKSGASAAIPASPVTRHARRRSSSL